MKGCDCEVAVKVGDVCYRCLKVRAGLFGPLGQGGTLSTEQEEFIGVYPPRSRDGWYLAGTWAERLTTEDAADHTKVNRGLKWIVGIGRERAELSA